MILLNFFNFAISIIGGFFYWVVLPILAYLGLKFLFFIIDISDEKDRKNYCRHYGYKGKRHWWD